MSLQLLLQQLSKLQNGNHALVPSLALQLSLTLPHLPHRRESLLSHPSILL